MEGWQIAGCEGTALAGDHLGPAQTPTLWSVSLATIEHPEQVQAARAEYFAAALTKGRKPRGWGGEERGTLGNQRRWNPREIYGEHLSLIAGPMDRTNSVVRSRSADHERSQPKLELPRERAARLGSWGQAKLVWVLGPAEERAVEAPASDPSERILHALHSCNGLAREFGPDIVGEDPLAVTRELARGLNFGAGGAARVETQPVAA